MAWIWAVSRGLGFFGGIWQLDGKLLDSDLAIDICGVWCAEKEPEGIAPSGSFAYYLGPSSAPVEPDWSGGVHPHRAVDRLEHL